MNLFSPLSASYNLSVPPTASRERHPLSAFLFASLLLHCSSAHAQQPTTEAPKAPATPAEPQTPAQIDLLETKIRFESNGDSRKEVHCIVKINSELGVRQFARLNFDYNRSFEKIEIPLVRVTHSNGGVADVLPSAISDNPNPAVVNAPAYQDVRVKSVRILGLAPSDTLEYRVITTVTKHPLAPDFWLDHSFDRTGVVSHELFELDVPTSRATQIRINPKTPPASAGDSGQETLSYRWRRETTKETERPNEAAAPEPDVVLTSFTDWKQLADRLKPLLEPTGEPSPDVFAKASDLAGVSTQNTAMIASVRARAIYAFVAQKIRTIDLPLGAMGFRARVPSDILASGYGTAEDKHFLFAAMANSFFGPARAGLVPISSGEVQDSPPRPSAFGHVLTMTGWPSINFWLDLNVEVAPFQVIPSQLRGKNALVVGPAVDKIWRRIDDYLPFQSKQLVSIDASITADGTLSSKVKYTMRGDNELLLRVAFHQSPREKWNEVAQLLALSDGFRGKVENVSASDPYATKDPFTVEYEISQPKFVDWSKKPVRIPAILPLVGLPDPPAKSTAPIELGTPLDVTTTVTLHLPPGTTVESPAGTAVDRDYAKFSSTYAATGNTLTAARHIQFLLRQLPANRALDYNTFVRAVQNDQSQRFTLFRPDSANPATPPKPKPQSPTP
jgi:hypothetical protein